MTGGIINPAYIAKLSPSQQKIIKTPGLGRKFFYEFICRHGNHVFNLSNTGGGKTNRNYFFADLLRHTENIIWISTGKSNEILPLLFLGCKVRIIIPKDSEFKIIGTDFLNKEPEIIEVSSPEEAWFQTLRPTHDDGHHLTYNKITIFEFRNTLEPQIRSDWMADLFTTLAERSREGSMPRIFPCSIFIDESQWVLAGTRITTDQKRTKTSEIITENVLEMRSIGCRVVFSAQDFKNVTPASRENMLNAVLGRGALVPADENREWARACGDPRTGVRSTSTFKREYARFVFDDGRFYSPGDDPTVPWKFPLYPEKEEDREKLYNMTVRYGRKFAGKTEKQEEQEELCPELGRFSALAIPPEKQEALKMSRFDAGVLTDEG
jgi:hypothetical protein